jgi:magnesium transporter
VRVKNPTRRAQLETVAEHLSEAYLRASPDDTLDAIAARLARERPAEIELVCAVSNEGRLLGTLPVRKLFGFPGSKSLAEVMRRDAHSARIDEDQEHAANFALQHGMNALAVVDQDGKLAGIVPAHTMLLVLRQEHVEDLHRLAGIQRETSRARHAIDDPPIRRFWHRIPWLVAGLAGSAAATGVMAGFEQRLSANVAIAFFIPAIVYLADAVGTQTEAIAVRGLSLTRSGITHLLTAELGVGTLIGAALGALAMPLVYFGFGDARLALAVGISIWVASSIAATLGLLLPWILAKVHVDPAHGSGPLATVIQDILSIVAYFLVLQLFGV